MLFNNEPEIQQLKREQICSLFFFFVPMKFELIAFLSSFLTKKRNDLFNKVLEQRSQYITVVLEDINQGQNAGAVLRTCNCLGIQNIFVVENHNHFKIDREVALGASKWLTIRHFHAEKDKIEKEPNDNHSKTCIETLKNEGYRILATTPHESGVPPEKIDLSKGKIAIVFGSEVNGISDTFRDQADEFIRIPMYGFTESYNISVSAAIILYQLNQQLRESKIDWTLSADEKESIRLEWLRRNLKRARQLEEKFYQERQILRNEK